MVFWQTKAVATGPSSSIQRLVYAGLLQLVVFVGGTVGYYVLTDAEYGWLSCAYMTAITITTVGYDESIPVTGDATLEVFTIGLIIIGMAAVLYFVSVLAAFLVEGDLREVFRKGKMERKIASYDSHIIVAGLGSTGRNIASEVIGAGEKCVLIDRDREKIDACLERQKRTVPFIEGDATDDDVLISAGIKRASGIAFCLGSDGENLFATISAHRLNEEVRIVTRGDDPRSEEKFLMAGAHRVIYINSLGGRHMAAELIRPQITNFLSLLFSHPERDHDVERIEMPNDSPFAGKTLADIDLRRHSKALVIAIMSPDGTSQFSPDGNDIAEAGCRLVILARGEDFATIKRYLSTGEWSPSKKNSKK